MKCGLTAYCAGVLGTLTTLASRWYSAYIRKYNIVCSHRNSQMTNYALCDNNNFKPHLAVTYPVVVYQECEALVLGFLLQRLEFFFYQPVVGHR